MSPPLTSRFKPAHLAVIALFLLLLVLSLLALRPDRETKVAVTRDQGQNAVVGGEEALQFLIKVLSSNPQERQELVLLREGIHERMQRAQNPAWEATLKSLQPKLFSPGAIRQNQRERGWYRLNYEIPYGAPITDLFIPLVTNELALQQRYPNAIERAAFRAREKQVRPTRCAFFIRRTKDGLRFDWDQFHQSLTHAVEEFCGSPQEGEEKFFVLTMIENEMIEEIYRHPPAPAYRWFRFGDPAYSNRGFTAALSADSPHLSQYLKRLVPRTKTGDHRVMPVAITVTWDQSVDPPFLKITDSDGWGFEGLRESNLPWTD